MHNSIIKAPCMLFLTEELVFYRDSLPEPGNRGATHYRISLAEVLAGWKIRISTVYISFASLLSFYRSTSPHHKLDEFVVKVELFIGLMLEAWQPRPV